MGFREELAAKGRSRGEWRGTGGQTYEEEEQQEEELPVIPPPNPIAEGMPISWTPEEIATRNAEVEFNPEEPSPEWIPPATAALATLWQGANEEQYQLWAQNQPTSGRTLEGYGGGGGGGDVTYNPRKYGYGFGGKKRDWPGSKYWQDKQMAGGGGSNEEVFQPNLADLSDVITPEPKKFKPKSLQEEKEYKSKSVTPWVYAEWVITMGQWRGF